MKIVADENIRYVREAFSELGDVQTMRGRDIKPRDVADADLLLVRSVTNVDEKLLKDSDVRFVGTATIGMDHIDREYLQSRDIAFSSAAGSNANSVAEYVVSALLALSEKKGFRLDGTSLGVIGVGNVGSQVVEKAEALGMTTVLNDPPLARKTQKEMYRPLEEALQCDIVTVHVPLTHTGPDPTYHLVASDFFGRMHSDAIFVNSSRGDVVDESALMEVIDRDELLGVCLDVWSGEPTINLDLLRKTDIATPHIAGYSLDGKVAGTAMIFDAACDFLGIAPPIDVLSLLPEPSLPGLSVTGDAATERVIRETVFQVYNILEDDRKLRRMTELNEAEVGNYFDNLRRDYPPRREFHNTELTFRGCDAEIRRKLLGLGFEGK